MYLWNDSEGLNIFLFEGFYDNILTSFGWQHVNIEVLLEDKTTEKIQDANYLLEVTGVIEPKESLKSCKESILDAIPKMDAEYFVVYHPEKWTYRAFYLMDDLEKVKVEKGTVYTILHVSIKVYHFVSYFKLFRTRILPSFSATMSNPHFLNNEGEPLKS